MRVLGNSMFLTKIRLILPAPGIFWILTELMRKCLKKFFQMTMIWISCVKKTSHQLISHNRKVVYSFKMRDRILNLLMGFHKTSTFLAKNPETTSNHPIQKEDPNYIQWLKSHPQLFQEVNFLKSKGPPHISHRTILRTYLS
jgi:hypothetical protein